MFVIVFILRCGKAALAQTYGSYLAANKQDKPDIWAAGGGARPLAGRRVLLADHELNASTFAARVTASTGASLAASALAALVVLRAA